MNFLKLPIEDPYIDGKKLAGNDGNYDFMPLPFRYLNSVRIVVYIYSSQAGNPVMTTVAFLASAVDPQVAAAAAKAALNEFSKQQFSVPTTIEEAHKNAVMKHKEATGECDPEHGLDEAGIAGVKREAESSEDKMDTDAAASPKENGSYLLSYLYSNKYCRRRTSCEKREARDDR